MISIRKYLEASPTPEPPASTPRAGLHNGSGGESVLLAAYRSVLGEMGRSGTDACPATGSELSQKLADVSEKLVSGAALAESETLARWILQDWGHSTARHLQRTAAEVKEMLLAMARTAESVGNRDQQCAHQIDHVTTQLRRIASLDDISQIRLSIEKSASELKSSIDRLNAEGRVVLDDLQAKVVRFQAKLEEAEQIASLDALTRLRSRLWMEGQLEQRIASAARFCVAVLDIDGFKSVNDTYGHILGDELLRQFANELRSACRSSDLVGRWGGDEFLVVIDCALSDAEAQIGRVRKWVCGDYTVKGASGPLKIGVSASIGLAEFMPPETLEQLLNRADAAMYQQKSAARAGASATSGGERRRPR
ncbi:MAG TPA: GGDEF domain-containing protein [Terracidiphilus sp.]|jgi:diguanylate cyclase (GGDEF)-like protein|nr:GGDEF domain-containing protein [Terracidiphilus sp.]